MLDIARRWFERKRLGGNVTWLWEPHVHPLLRCNIWHVDGRDRNLLVDTGLGVAPLREAIADLIDKPLDAVATHIHYDHVGGLHEFETRLMHEAEAAQMNPYEEFGTLKTADFGELLALLSDAGYTLESDLLALTALMGISLFRLGWTRRIRRSRITLSPTRLRDTLRRVRIVS